MILIAQKPGPGDATLIHRAQVTSKLVLATTLAIIATACSAGRADDGHTNPSGTRTANGAISTAIPAGSSVVTSTPAQDMRVAASVTTSVRVFKDPSCGCCNAWIKHMRNSGFNVTTVDEPSQGAMDSIKRAHGITQSTASCHTAEVGRYVIEGHVPADLVQKLLREHPADVAGLSVPGMVTGSPGMEGPDPQHYTVVAIMRDGSTRPYAQR